MLSLLHDRRLRILLRFLGWSVGLHLIWELLQAPLYTCFAQLWTCVLLCLRAAVTGDLLSMLVIYALLAAVHRDWGWLGEPNVLRHPATWIVPVVTGMLIAVAIERWALGIDRWEYTPAMPLLPIVRVGLAPVLQMIVIPLLTIVLSSRAERLSLSDRRTRPSAA